MNVRDLAKNKLYFILNTYGTPEAIAHFQGLELIEPTHPNFSRGAFYAWYYLEHNSEEALMRFGEWLMNNGHGNP